MRVGGRHGAQQAFSPVSQMTEPPLRCEGPSPEQPEGLCPERRAMGGWPSRPLAAPAHSCLCVFRPACKTEGWEPEDGAPRLPGASVRNSTCDKVMRQNSDGKANQTSGFPPGIS